MLTFSDLNALLAYDPISGILTWKVSRGRAKAGSVVGTLDSDGYLIFQAKGANLKVHRVAFLLMTGKWPEGLIDHENRIRSDNRWGNLRDASNSVNQQNKVSAYINSKSGLLGVHQYGDKFRAQISRKGVRILIGTFDTPEQAHSAYLEEKKKLHEGCTL